VRHALGGLRRLAARARAWRGGCESVASCPLRRDRSKTARSPRPLLSPRCVSPLAGRPARRGEAWARRTWRGAISLAGASVVRSLLSSVVRHSLRSARQNEPLLPPRAGAASEATRAAPRPARDRAMHAACGESAPCALSRTFAVRVRALGVAASLSSFSFCALRALRAPLPRCAPAPRRCDARGARCATPAKRPAPRAEPKRRALSRARRVAVVLPTREARERSPRRRLARRDLTRGRSVDCCFVDSQGLNGSEKSMLSGERDGSPRSPRCGVFVVLILVLAFVPPLSFSSSSSSCPLPPLVPVVVSIAILIQMSSCRWRCSRRRRFRRRRPLRCSRRRRFVGFVVLTSLLPSSFSSGSSSSSLVPSSLSARSIVAALGTRERGAAAFEVNVKRLVEVRSNVLLACVRQDRQDRDGDRNREANISS
jgi:hypothetical protein